MINLPSSSKDIICNYINSGYLPQGIITKILKAEDNEQIINSLSCLFCIDQEREDKIWRHIRNNVWDIDDEATLFSLKDCVFLHLLLQNKGILLKKRDIINAKVKPIKTYELLDSVETGLKDLGIIDIYKLRNHEVVYVLNLEFYREVFKDE